MIHRIETAGEWANALQEVERQFWYPLGPRATFRIEHGDDYTRFFRAMGPAVTFCEERDGEVRGVVSVMFR